jgi:hypothetical protein
MAKAIIYADSASPLDPNLCATRASAAQSCARVSPADRVGATG